jgi:hypothetical protein
MGTPFGGKCAFICPISSPLNSSRLILGQTAGGVKNRIEDDPRFPPLTGSGGYEPFAFLHKQLDTIGEENRPVGTP